MKFLAVLLSLYFLTLNFFPCEDSGEFSDHKTEVKVKQVKVDMEKNSTESDDCSPFCQCNCCHVHIATLDLNTSQAIEPEISTLIIQKGEKLGQEIPHVHFQPPKVEAV